jgi:hypothetical protein
MRVPSSEESGAPGAEPEAMGNPPALEAKSAGPSRERHSCRRRLRLDRLADGTKDGTDLAAKEDQGDDRDNRNESEDERR